METGDPYYVTLNNITYPRFNRTLAIYNDTSPFYLAKDPVPNLTTPWNLTCYESEIQTWAVFGNMMYYSCRVSGSGKRQEAKGRFNNPQALLRIDHYSL